MFVVTDGASPTPMGPPRATSPLPPSTPPMQDMIPQVLEDRRPPLPIGGERTQRKVPGLAIDAGFDYGEQLWNFQNRK